MGHAQLINYARYQIGWFACVLGGASHHPWPGCLIAMILVGVHLALSVERVLEVRLVVLAAAIGVVVEIIQIARPEDLSICFPVKTRIISVFMRT